MIRFLRSLLIAAVVGLVTVLPFMGMEFVNRGQYGEPFPWPVFLILWILAAGFTLALLAILGDRRAGENPMRKPTRLALRVAVMIAFAWVWLSTVIDQMPCFLGAPLCD